ncbi:MAG: acetate uptake transporter [Chloroflexales bacterium]
MVTRQVIRTPVGEPVSPSRIPPSPSQTSEKVVATPKIGNPAVVGLAAFGLTTMMLQFYNVGWVGLGPVVWLGLIFGGLAQFIAGLQEQKTGNNFGYVAFTSYGAFWISLGVMFLANTFNILTANSQDVGWFLVAWTMFTIILWFGSMRINGMLALTFTLLLIGFIMLVIGHFGFPIFIVVAAYDLMACALSAWYVMAHLLFHDLFGRDVLPVGKPWIR